MGQRWGAFAALAAFACSASLALAPAAGAQDPIPDPSANRNLSAAAGQACTSPSSQACVNDALGDLNSARVAEGVVPMVLPGDWGSLTIPQQLLVLSNLERVDRGLAPVLGLSAALNADAQTGADNDTDPSPTNNYGDAVTENWEGGYISPLLSDFGWMYDDGLGSPNGDCTSTNQSGCWGHRHDILWDLAEPAVMGAAYQAHSGFGPSETELFVGGDTQAGPGQLDAPIAPTWATIAATLPVGVSTTSLSLAAGANTTQLSVWASGETMHVAAAVSAGSSTWRVSPSSCQLNAGQRCTLTLTATSAAPGPGTLTLTGPNGSQTVTLSGPTTKPKLRVKLNHSKIHRGQRAKLTGSVSPSEPGKQVELQQRRGHSWHNAASAKVGRTGGFRFTIRAPSKGKFSYRVTIAASGGFLSATSNTVTLRVS